MKSLKSNGRTDTISTHEMRFQFDRVLRAVKAGRALTLTYRNRPLARIVPLQQALSVAENDPVFRLHELADPIGPLSNTEIDTVIMASEALFDTSGFFALMDARDRMHTKATTWLRKNR